MTDEPRKGVTRILLPDGPVEADYDDDEEPVDLDAEVVLLPDGTRLTQSVADAIVADVHRQMDEHPERFAGRPSLTGPGKHSPQVAFRVPADLAEQVDEQAEREGMSRSALARKALADYIAAHRRAS